MGKIKYRNFILNIELLINESMMPVMLDGYCASLENEIRIAGKLTTKAPDFEIACINAIKRAKLYMRKKGYRHGMIKIKSKKKSKTKVINI